MPVSLGESNMSAKNSGVYVPAKPAVPVRRSPLRTSRGESDMSSKNYGVYVPPPLANPTAGTTMTQNVIARAQDDPAFYNTLGPALQEAAANQLRNYQPSYEAIVQGNIANFYNSDYAKAVESQRASAAENNNVLASRANPGGATSRAAPAPVAQVNPEASSGIVPVGITPAAAETNNVRVVAPGFQGGAPATPVEGPSETAGGESGGVGQGLTAEGRGGIYGNLFQNVNKRNPRRSLSITSDELRKAASSRLGL